MDNAPERVKFIPYKNKQILLIDFSDCSPEQALQVISQAKALIGKQPKASLLVLTNVKNGHFNPTVSQAMKGFTLHNKPFVKKSAVIGLSGIQRIIYAAVVKFSGRKLPLFEDEIRAKEWLIKEGDSE